MSRGRGPVLNRLLMDAVGRRMLPAKFSQGLAELDAMLAAARRWANLAWAMPALCRDAALFSRHRSSH